MIGGFLLTWWCYLCRGWDLLFACCNICVLFIYLSSQKSVTWAGPNSENIKYKVSGWILIVRSVYVGHFFEAGELEMTLCDTRSIFYKLLTIFFVLCSVWRGWGRLGGLEVMSIPGGGSVVCFFVHVCIWYSVWFSFVWSYGQGKRERLHDLSGAHDYSVEYSHNHFVEYSHYSAEYSHACSVNILMIIPWNTRW